MSLEDAPDDIINEIACWLDDPSINALIRTSKRFNNILSGPGDFHWVKRVSDLTGVKFSRANKYIYKRVKTGKPNELLIWAAMHEHTEYLKLLLHEANHKQLNEVLILSFNQTESFKIIISHARQIGYDVYHSDYKILRLCIEWNTPTNLAFLLKEIPPPQEILDELWVTAARVQKQFCACVLTSAGARDTFNYNDWLALNNIEAIENTHGISLFTLGRGVGRSEKPLYVLKPKLIEAGVDENIFNHHHIHGRGLDLLFSGIFTLANCINAGLNLNQLDQFNLGRIVGTGYSDVIKDLRARGVNI